MSGKVNQAMVARAQAAGVHAVLHKPLALRDAEAACDEVEPLLAEQPDLGVAGLMRAALLTLARR